MDTWLLTLFEVDNKPCDDTCVIFPALTVLTFMTLGTLSVFSIPQIY